VKYLAFLIALGSHCYAQDVYQEALNKLRSEGKGAASEFVEKNTNQTLYDIGFVLYRKARTNDALEWYKTLYEATSEPRYLIGQANLYMWNRSYLEAIATAEKVLALNPSDLQRARAYHAIARCSINLNDISKANKYTTMSMELYSKLGMPGGLAIGHLNLATIATSKKDYDTAEIILAKSLAYNKRSEKPFNLGYAHELRSEISWGRGHPAQALEWAEEAKVAYFHGGNLVAAWLSSTRIALLRAMQGDSEATKILRDLEAISFGTDYELLAEQANLIRIYTDRCAGKDYSIRVLNLRSSEKISAASLNFMEECECP
jgi:tetratricopeptide (TPR) repeat protein